MVVIRRVFLLVLILAGYAFGQQQNPSLSNPLGGNINATSTACATPASCVWQKLPPNTTVATVTLSGTFSGTFLVEQSSDGGNTFTTVATYTTAQTAVPFTVSGMTDFRVRCSAYTSGSAAVTLQAASATATGAGGSVSLNGNNILTGTNSFLGLMQCKNLENILCVDTGNSQGWSGSDMGAWINSAFASCANDTGFCEVWAFPSPVAGQQVSYATTIAIPQHANSHNSLRCSPALTLLYTGASYGIDVTPPGALTNSPNFSIYGCTITGTSAGLAGIHTKVVNKGIIQDVLVTAFTKGAGWLNEGADSIHCISCNFGGNSVGIHMTTVSAFAGSYPSNINVVTAGRISSNSAWGVWEDGNQSVAGINQGDQYVGVDIEGNGVNPITVATASASASLTSNIVTVTVASTASLTPGMMVLQSAFSVSPCFNGRFPILTIPNTTTYTYFCTSGNGTATGGTVVTITGNIFVEMCNDCTFNGGFSQQQTGAAGMEAEFELGDTLFEPVGTNLLNWVFGSAGYTSTINDVTSKQTRIEGNIELSAPTNFYNHTSNAQTFGLFIGRNTSNATNYMNAFVPVGSDTQGIVLASASNHDNLFFGGIEALQHISDQGTACTNGELALSAGWQSTGSATVTAVAGGGQTCSWTITTGTTTAANPTVTDTLTNALPNATTVCEMNIHGGTHTAAAGEGFTNTTLSATAPIFTFIGTPTAGGTTYFVTRRCGP